MENHSRETLRRVTQNNPSLTTLIIADTDDNNYGDDDGEFYSDSSDDYSTLGAAIANNTHLETLEVVSSSDMPLGVCIRQRILCDGLKSNSSISNLYLWCNGRNIAGGVGQEILQTYQENNSQLTALSIYDADLQNGGDRVIVDTIRSCRNLQSILLNSCNITHERLLPIADAIRGHLLEELNLNGNRIGNAGCDTIATLLEEPNCNIRTLSLRYNTINTEGATTIANSLRTNNQLQNLYLQGNPIDQSVQDNFCKVLCNTTSIGHTYASNHTLQKFDLGGQPLSQHLESLLKMNKDTDNEHHVSIKKILNYHPNIDVEPLFEWGLEDDDEERNLKALPYVIDWFERAGIAVADDGKEYGIEERKLSAIFQFAKAMPLLLEGISRIKVDKKRKRSE